MTSTTARKLTMSYSPQVGDETARLQALREHVIMDTPPEPLFDEIVRRAAALCETPIALLTFVDERRQWFKARVGFGLPELPRGIGFDSIAMLQPEPLIICDTLRDTRFASDPLVMSELNIRFYAGAPLTTEEGIPIGALSVMDYAARDLSPSQMQALLEQAQQAMLQLRLRRQRTMLVSKINDAPSGKIVPGSEERERRIILPDVVIRFGPDLRYLYVSPLSDQALGIPPDSLLGRRIGEERISVPFAPLLRSALDRTLEHHSIEQVEFLHQSPFGKRLFQSRLMPEESGGEIKTILAITRDITPIYREEAKPLVTPSMPGRSDTAPPPAPGGENSAEFALRMPLASVLGLTEQLLGTDLNATQQGLVEQTRISAQALLALLNGTPESNAENTVLSRESFDLCSVSKASPVQPEPAWSAAPKPKEELTYDPPTDREPLSFHDVEITAGERAALMAPLRIHEQFEDTQKTAAYSPNVLDGGAVPAAEPHPLTSSAPMPLPTDNPAALPTALSLSFDEILDRRALLARMEGNIQSLRSLAGACQSESVRLMQAMQQAIESGNRTELLHAAQELRSNLRGMEACAAVDAVTRLELAARQGRPEDAEILIVRLQRELDRLHAAVSAIILQAKI